MNGKEHGFKSCLAPKNWGEPGSGQEGITRRGCDPNKDDCWKGAGSADPRMKINYHKSWDYNSDSIENDAQIWTEYLRPNQDPRSPDNCYTYAWAYDEQVCSKKPHYKGDGDCYVDNHGTMQGIDNPFGPLGSCVVYDNTGKYRNPNIQIDVTNIMKS